MTYTSRIIEDHFRREGRPRDSNLDPAYGYQMALLRDLLQRLDVILDDEGVPRWQAERIIRCLLYGAPSVADAELRINLTDEITQLRASQTVVMQAPASLAKVLGLPTDV